MNNEQDETTAVKPNGTAEGDHRDYAKDDETAAEGLRHAFGAQDGAEGAEDGQEAAEGQDDAPNRIRIDLAWSIGLDGTPSVGVMHEIPARGYSVEDIEHLSAQLAETATLARRMAEVWKWLTKNGIEGDQRKELVMSAFKTIERTSAKEALLSLAFGGMFRGWSG